MGIGQQVSTRLAGHALSMYDGTEQSHETPRLDSSFAFN